MKSYKEYEKRSLGGSDMAALIMVGSSDEGVKTDLLKFGEDGGYSAYLVDGEAEIGAHYSKVATFTHWITIYDDDSCVFRSRGREINVYRAGEFGCIIQVIG